MNEDWVLSVEQLGEYVRRHLAGDPLLRAVRVRGELSGFKRHTSGHLYFAIRTKRPGCSASCSAERPVPGL